MNKHVKLTFKINIIDSLYISPMYEKEKIHKVR